MNAPLICGVDEVGRGPLAGPVVAAAVVRPEAAGQLRYSVKDSKKLTPARRQQLYAEIIAQCLYSVASASVTEIDRLNIFHASLLAMQRCILRLHKKYPLQMVYIDGKFVPDNLPLQACPIVGGDDKVPEIAAASILAKVIRDRAMAGIDIRYPGYGWCRNNGYGTAEHSQALQTLGPTPHHRKSFAPVAQSFLDV